MVAEVAVLQPVHHAVGERVELLGRAALRNAGAAAAGFGEGRDGDQRRAGEAGVGRRRPVDVELPQSKVGGVGAHAEDEFGLARTGAAGAVDVGRQQAAVGGRGAEALLRRGLAREHPGAVHRADLGAREIVLGRREHVVAEVVRVAPDARLAVIVERRVGEVVGEIRAGRIGALRDRDALVIVGIRVGDRELRDEPAVCGAVVEHDGVAVVVGRAEAAQALEERIDRQRAVQLGAVLVPDHQILVDRLHIVVGADVAVGVRRRPGHTKRSVGPAEPLADAGEGEVHRRGEQRRGRRLEHRIAEGDRPVHVVARHRLHLVLRIRIVLRQGHQRQRRRRGVPLVELHRRRAQVAIVGVVVACVGAGKLRARGGEDEDQRGCDLRGELELPHRENLRGEPANGRRGRRSLTNSCTRTRRARMCVGGGVLSPRNAKTRDFTRLWFGCGEVGSSPIGHLTDVLGGETGTKLVPTKVVPSFPSCYRATARAREPCR